MFTSICIQPIFQYTDYNIVLTIQANSSSGKRVRICLNSPLKILLHCIHPLDSISVIKKYATGFDQQQLRQPGIEPGAKQSSTSYLGHMGMLHFTTKPLARAVKSVSNK